MMYHVCLKLPICMCVLSMLLAVKPNNLPNLLLFVYFILAAGWIKCDESIVFWNSLMTFWQETKLKIFLQIGGAINMVLSPEVFLGQNLEEGNHRLLRMLKQIMRELYSVKMIRRIYIILFKYVSFSFEFFLCKHVTYTLFP